ncbi:hypothetical protein BDV98DRAFT_401748 [Pterulicium gracile]|uniref:Uncharacterized protein n=1 Tax=Pterulicium gracile TaxID=1884261 RepID=A0A5C3QA88_9AGAR|nr:hypothetical protein BDV98DRAFT_401748 [Pterula gracilis]
MALPSSVEYASIQIPAFVYSINPVSILLLVCSLLPSYTLPPRCAILQTRIDN